jgi:ubiquinone/menaquinone biosynthesis C-methylase UbiE
MCKAATFEELQNPLYVERQKRLTAGAYNWWSRVWDLARFTNGAIYDAALDSLEPTHQRALDVGCGTGILSARLAATGRHVLGVDLSPAMIRQARRKQTANLDFAIGDAERLPVAGQSFDAVVSLISFHHYPHPDRALAEFHRALRPGGRLVLVIFDRNSRYIELAQRVNRWTKPIAGRTWQKTADEALELVRAAGFGHIETIPVPYWIKTLAIVADHMDEE